MDGNTPINVFEPQFSQREASEISEVPMPTINNWLKREAFVLRAQAEGAKRRFFSIAEIARLHAMHYCTQHLELSPEAAAVAASGLDEYFSGKLSEIVRDDGAQFEVWHWAHRRPSHVDSGWAWGVQGVWQDRKTGAFFAYHPGIFTDEEPQGPPHFPCVCIPTSELGRRIFLVCADRLIAEHSSGEASE